MTTKVAEVRGDDAVGLGVFLMMRNGTGYFGHGGADVGFQADVIASLDGGRGIAIMTNSEAGMNLMPEIERSIIAEMKWPGADEMVTRIALDPAKRTQLIGRYDTPPAPWEVIERDGKLIGRTPFGKGSELVPIAPDTVVDRSDGKRMKLTDAGLTVTVPNTPALEIPRVTTTHPLWLWEAGKSDEAVASLQAIKDGKSEEERINLLGYRLMQQDAARAAQLLRLNVLAFPDSSNAQDSLGEALAKSGDKPGAIKAYEASLALLAADPRIPGPQKPALELHAKEELAKLRR
jgi:hypothetical protein